MMNKNYQIDGQFRVAGTLFLVIECDRFTEGIIVFQGDARRHLIRTEKRQRWIFVQRLRFLAHNGCPHCAHVHFVPHLSIQHLSISSLNSLTILLCSNGILWIVNLSKIYWPDGWNRSWRRQWLFASGDQCPGAERMSSKDSSPRTKEYSNNFHPLPYH